MGCVRYTPHFESSFLDDDISVIKIQLQVLSLSAHRGLHYIQEDSTSPIGSLYTGPLAVELTEISTTTLTVSGYEEICINALTVIGYESTAFPILDIGANKINPFLCKPINRSNI